MLLPGPLRRPLLSTELGIAEGFTVLAPVLKGKVTMNGTARADTGSFSRTSASIFSLSGSSSATRARISPASSVPSTSLTTGESGCCRRNLSTPSTFGSVRTVLDCAREWPRAGASFQCLC